MIENAFEGLSDEFFYPDLATYFTCEGTTEKPEFTHTCCFSRALKTAHVKMDNTYRIKIYKQRDTSIDNFLYFTRKEVEKYFSYLYEMYSNMDLHIEDENDYEMIVYLKINDYHLYHTFILTFIRYLYEYRYAFALSEAMQLKKTFRFRKMSIYSLMMLVVLSNSFIAELMSEDMSHFGFSNKPKLLNNKELQTQLSVAAENIEESKFDGYTLVKMKGIMDIAPTISHWRKVNELTRMIEDAGFKLNSRHPLKTKEYLDEHPFRERYPIYRSNYDKIIKFQEANVNLYVDTASQKEHYYEYASDDDE